MDSQKYKHENIKKNKIKTFKNFSIFPNQFFFHFSFFFYFLPFFLHLFLQFPNKCFQKSPKEKHIEFLSHFRLYFCFCWYIMKNYVIFAQPNPKRRTLIIIQHIFYRKLFHFPWHLHKKINFLNEKLFNHKVLEKCAHNLSRHQKLLCSKRRILKKSMYNKI